MFDELTKLLDGNEDGLRLLGEAKTAQEGLTKKLNTFEVDAKKAFEKRDEYSSKIKLVQDRLGIEDINEDALTKALSGKKVDDVELANLKALIETANREKGEIETSYKGKLSKYALVTELQKTGLAQKASDENTYKLLEMMALDGVSYEDDTIAFKNADGSTKYLNGKPMTLNDRVDELYNTPSYAGLFKADGKGGTGSNPQGGKGAGNGVDYSKLSPTEKMKMGRK